MDQKYINVSFQEAKKIIDTQNCIILVVRTDEEFYTGHAEGAVNLDVDAINSETASEIIPDKTTPILVYCKTGERANLAAEVLSELGYKQIYNIGSLVEWPYGLSYD